MAADSSGSSVNTEDNNSDKTTNTAEKTAKKDSTENTALPTSTDSTSPSKKSSSKKTTTGKSAKKKASARKSTAGKSAAKSSAKKAASPTVSEATGEDTLEAATESSSSTKASKKKVPVSKSKKTGSAASTVIEADIDDNDLDGDEQDSGSKSTVVPYERGAGHYMDAEQLAMFSQKLADWKQQLMEEVDRTVGHMKDDATNFPDPNDRATQEEEFSLELRTRDRERKLIKKINEAQKRIDDDEYGYCQTCGIEIGISRLEARPTAELCIDCKTLEEIRERQTA